MRRLRLAGRDTLSAVERQLRRGARALESALMLAIDGARRLGATQLAVLAGKAPDRPRERQIELFSGNLRWASRAR